MNARTCCLILVVAALRAWPAGAGETEALEAANAVRATHGLAPLPATETSYAPFARLWAEWQDVRGEWSAARARLETAERLSEEGLAGAALLYVPQASLALGATGTGPAARDGAWLLRVLQAEVAVARAKVDALQEWLGIRDAESGLSPEAVAEIDAAERAWHLQRERARRLRERELDPAADDEGR